MGKAKPLDDQTLRRWVARALASPWHGQMPIGAEHQILCSALREPGRFTRLMLTFDVGYHASGWWKNGDYDRCWHLSVSHPTQFAVETPDEKEVFAWARRLWGEHASKCWIEGAASVFDPYRLPNIVNARLFVDEHGEPIKPEGEVYEPLRPWSPKVLETIGGDVR